MKKRMAALGTTISATVALLMMGGSSALAQYPPTIPPTAEGRLLERGPAEPVDPGEIAFTGADLLPWVIAVVALVAVGGLILFAARRRAASGSA
jgi:hypothetical protein